MVLFSTSVHVLVENDEASTKQAGVLSSISRAERCPVPPVAPASNQHTQLRRSAQIDWLHPSPESSDLGTEIRIPPTVAAYKRMPPLFQMQLLLLLLLLTALTAPVAARMRRPWESDEDYAYNTKHGIMSRTPPKGWGRGGANSGEIPFPGLTDEARAHCTKDGHQCDKAERSAPCLLAQNGFLSQIDAFKAAGYLTAQDLVDGDFT